MKKSYADCDDTEKYWLREYTSWAKSDAPIALRLAMVEQFYKMIKNHGIEHLVIGRNK